MPNRFAAQRHLNQIIKEAEVANAPLAVMYLDLDKFKLVNDTLGHAAGDALLVSVAARLRNCFRVVDLVSRQGGDEFVVLMAPGTSRVDATQAAQRISAAVALPHQLDGEPIHIGCSIGIALYPGDGDSGDVLLRHADTALHAAKASGRNAWRFFNQELLSSAIERRQMENGLRHALGTTEFELFYQPKVRLSDGALCGCEALLRWQHPVWGWVDPARFIRSAEESGLIMPLGRWVLNQAVRQAKRWDRSGMMAGAVAVNVSALELRQGDFASYISDHLAESDLDPIHLQLELTESALMRDVQGASTLLQRLKNIGVSLAIDDFGTGYSSLSYLADMPIDLLKVDRSFVHGIDHAAPRRQTLLRAVLALADNLAIAAVAEGVETGAEADFLTAAGCVQGQGYYYSRAVDARTFERDFPDAAYGLITATAPPDGASFSVMVCVAGYFGVAGAEVADVGAVLQQLRVIGALAEEGQRHLQRASGFVGHGADIPDLALAAGRDDVLAYVAGEDARLVPGGWHGLDKLGAIGPAAICIACRRPGCRTPSGTGCHTPRTWRLAWPRVVITSGSWLREAKVDGVALMEAARRVIHRPQDHARERQRDVVPWP